MSNRPPDLSKSLEQVRSSLRAKLTLSRPPHGTTVGELRTFLVQELHRLRKQIDELNHIPGGMGLMVALSSTSGTIREVLEDIRRLKVSDADLSDKLLLQEECEIVLDQLRSMFEEASA
jgi:hypothetical protein